MAPLTNLTALVANGNRIADVTPIGALTRLTRLELNANLITSLDALAPLQQLTIFDASGNAIAPPHCPVAPVAKSKALSDFCTTIRR